MYCLTRDGLVPLLSMRLEMNCPNRDVQVPVSTIIRVSVQSRLGRLVGTTFEEGAWVLLPYRQLHGRVSVGLASSAALATPRGAIKYMHIHARDCECHLQCQSKCARRFPAHAATYIVAVLGPRTWNQPRTSPGSGTLANPPVLGAGAVPLGTYCQTPQCHLVKRPRLRGLPD